MENKSSTDEMYFLFSVVSSFIRCPHVQYTIPALQCVRHALRCDFGSTLIISHSSVFPAAIIASFDFAEGIERTMLLKITLKCFSLRVIFDLLNQVVNVITM